jgi:hypothetical protein
MRLYSAGYQPLPGRHIRRRLWGVLLHHLYRGRICSKPPDGPWRCFCSDRAVECEQVCIPEACAGQCTRSCSGIGADCGCEDYLSCQAEVPGVFHCLPTGKTYA